MILKNGKELTEDELIEIQNTIANEDLRQDILELTGYPTPENARDMRKIWMGLLGDKQFEKARATAEEKAVREYWTGRFAIHAEGFKEFLAQLDEFNFVSGFVDGKHYTYEVVGDQIRLVNGCAGFPARLFAAYIKNNVLYTFYLDGKPVTPIGVKVDVRKNEAEIEFRID